MTRNEYHTIETAIQDLEDEMEEAKSVLMAMNSELANIKHRQDDAKRNLGIARSNLQFLRSQAQIVLLEQYREAVKLIRDNLKNLDWLDDELLRNTAARDSLSTALRSLEKELNKYKKELSQWGQIYHYQKR